MRLLPLEKSSFAHSFMCLEFAWHNFGRSVCLVCSATRKHGKMIVSQFSLFSIYGLERYLVEYHSHTLRSLLLVYIIYSV